MSDLTKEETAHVARILSREGSRGTGHFFPDRHAIAQVLETLQDEHGIDLSSLRPDPSQRYIVEQHTPPGVGGDGTPYWFVHDLWTGEPVMSVSESEFIDAEGLAHDTAARLNAS